MRRAQRRKYHFIYKTTCKVTSKYYYGMHSTDDLNDGYIGSGKHLRYSINKHGKDNHVCERLEFFDSRELLKEKEKEIVNENLRSDPLCMNLMDGGSGGFISTEVQFKRSSAGGKKVADKIKNDMDYKDEFSSKVSNGVKKGYENGRIGKNYFSWKGKIRSKETKKKMSLAQQGKQSGEKNSQYGKRWITNGVEVKVISKGDEIPEGWRFGRKIKYNYN